MDDGIEDWRYVFRHGIAPCLSDEQLGRLEAGLAADDSAITQGAVVRPFAGFSESTPALQCCPMCFALWSDRGTATVELMNRKFYDLMLAANNRLAAVGTRWNEANTGWFTRWVDTGFRRDAFGQLLMEVRYVKAVRAGLAAVDPATVPWVSPGPDKLPDATFR